MYSPLPIQKAFCGPPSVSDEAASGDPVLDGEIDLLVKELGDRRGTGCISIVEVKEHGGCAGVKVKATAKRFIFVPARVCADRRTNR
jgi:hypothetical protein